MMTKENYPRTLIVEHQFDNQTGLGITLSNLFANWPKENLAILAPLIDVTKCDESRPCQKYIGTRFNPSKHMPKTGILGHVRRKIRKLYYFLGLNEARYHFTYSEKDINEARDFNPKIIFCCLGSLNSMKDCQQIIKAFPKAKLVLYIVDDWVNTKENNRLLSIYWKKQNDKYFRSLLQQSAGLLSICPYMTEVYKGLYNKEFVPFHNPVDCDYWSNLSVTSKYGNGVKSLLYVGKINDDTKQCLLDVAASIDILNSQGSIRYVFDVYSPDFLVNQSIFTTNGSSHLFPAISHDKIPLLMKSYDALLLTLGFSKKTIEYVRLSMPTKVSEYLASGVPVILYCPEEIALAKYLGPQNCSINCFERSIHMLKDSISHLIDEKYCQTLKRNAIELAKSHNMSTVRLNFEKTLQSFIN